MTNTFEKTPCGPFPFLGVGTLPKSDGGGGGGGNGPRTGVAAPGDDPSDEISRAFHALTEAADLVASGRDLVRRHGARIAAGLVRYFPDRAIVLVTSSTTGFALGFRLSEGVLTDGAPFGSLLASPANEDGGFDGPGVLWRPFEDFFCAGDPVEAAALYLARAIQARETIREIPVKFGIEADADSRVEVGLGALIEIVRRRHQDGDGDGDG